MRFELVLACAAMTAVTFLCRSLLTVSLSKVTITPWIERFLAVIPFAALTALVAPYLLVAREGSVVDLSNPYLLAGVPTLLVSYRTKNLLLSVGVGIGVLVGTWVAVAVGSAVSVAVGATVGSTTRFVMLSPA